MNRSPVPMNRGRDEAVESLTFRDTPSKVRKGHDMTKDIVHTAIDVGTSKVSTLIAHRHANGDVDVLGVGIAPSEGLRKGVVVNIQEAEDAIHNSVAEAKRSAGVNPSSAYVGVSGSHIEVFPRWGSLRSLMYNAPLSPSEIDRAVDAAFPAELPPENQVLHLIPRLYAVDGLKGVRNPVGMHAQRLDVETLCIVGQTAPIQNLVTAVENTKINVRALVASPVSTGEASLSRDEKEMGVTLVDIGGGATTVSVYQQGCLWNAAVLPLGGYQFTTDLAVALNTPYDTAEEVKLRHGQASLDTIDDENVEIQAFGDRRTVRVERRVISRYLHDRAEELFRLIGLKVKGFGFPAMPPAGIVLTGGGANLPGIERVARRILGTPVRTAGPVGVDGLPEGMLDPAYVASAGVLLWGTRHLASLDSVRREERRLNKTSGYAQNNAGPLSWLRERVRKVAL